MFVFIKYNFVVMQKEVEISAVIGFSGNVYDGLLLHPDNEHIIYPLGSTVVVRHILSRTQTFLRGHTHNISCKSLSTQPSRFRETASTSPAPSTPSPVKWPRSSYGTSNVARLNTTSNSTKTQYPVSLSLPTHACSPLRAVSRTSTFSSI